MNFGEFLKEEMERDPQFRREWEEGEPEFQIISTLVGARSRLGWTQNELAKRMGTDQATISRAENTGKVTAEFMARFAAAVGGDATMSIKVPGRRRMTFRLVSSAPTVMPAGSGESQQFQEVVPKGRKQVTFRFVPPRQKPAPGPGGLTPPVDPLRSDADASAPAAIH